MSSSKSRRYRNVQPAIVCVSTVRNVGPVNANLQPALWPYETNTYQGRAAKSRDKRETNKERAGTFTTKRQVSLVLDDTPAQ
jgi:hypothetical protein